MAFGGKTKRRHRRGGKHTRGGKRKRSYTHRRR